MLSYLNIEFHTIIVSFVMTVLVSGCVFMYFRTRVSRVEEMMIKQSQVMKNYVAQVENIRHERVMGMQRMGVQRMGGAVGAVGAVGGAYEIQAPPRDNRMDVSDDGGSVHNVIELEINDMDQANDDESTSTYDGSSDSEEVDDTDMSESGDEMDVVGKMVVGKMERTDQIDVVALQSPLDVPATVDAVNSGIMSVPQEDDLSMSAGSTSSRMTKKDLCERITSLKISTRSVGTLMKLKRDELATMLESSGLE
jgi:hypothetical protein